MAEKIKDALIVAAIIGMILLLPGIEGGVKAGTLSVAEAIGISLLALVMIVPPALAGWWNEDEEDEE